MKAEKFLKSDKIPNIKPMFDSEIGFIIVCEVMEAYKNHCVKKGIKKFYRYVDGLTTQEYDDKSLTDHIETLKEQFLK